MFVMHQPICLLEQNLKTHLFNHRYLRRNHRVITSYVYSMEKRSGTPKYSKEEIDKKRDYNLSPSLFFAHVT